MRKEYNKFNELPERVKEHIEENNVRIIYLSGQRQYYLFRNCPENVGYTITEFKDLDYITKIYIHAGANDNNNIYICFNYYEKKWHRSWYYENLSKYKFENNFYINEHGFIKERNFETCEPAETDEDYITPEEAIELMKD